MKLKQLMEKDLKPVIFYTMLFLFILGFSLTGLGYDYDYWARISVGKYFMQTGTVPKVDFFSYTPTHTWYDHEWGSGVIFYVVNQLFSHTGTLFLSVILIFITFLFISQTIKLRGVKTTHAYNFMFYFFSFNAMYYVADQLIRCQLFSFMFFAIFLYILELSRKGFDKPLWVLPFLMIIWNNLHGGCASGIGLIAIYIIGEFLNKKTVGKYILPFVFTILLLPINPWGMEYLNFLLKATTMHRVDIIEWFSMFSNHFGPYDYIEFKIFTAVLILPVLILAAQSIRNKKYDFDKTKYLAILVTLYLAIKHVKLVPLSVITTSVFLYDDFYTIFNTLTNNYINKMGKIKDLFMYIIILGFVVVNIRPANFQPFLDWNKFPIRIIEFIKINKLEGNLFINYGLGSFAGYKLYPHNKTFIDGRYEEVYYDFMMPILHEFYIAGKDWDTPLIKFPTELVVVEKAYPVYGAMLLKPDWTKIFEDDHYALFVKSNKVRKEYVLPSPYLQHYKDTLFDTDLDFSGEQWKKK